MSILELEKVAGKITSIDVEEFDDIKRIYIGTSEKFSYQIGWSYDDPEVYEDQPNGYSACIEDVRSDNASDYCYTPLGDQWFLDNEDIDSSEVPDAAKFLKTVGESLDRSIGQMSSDEIKDLINTLKNLSKGDDLGDKKP